MAEKYTEIFDKWWAVFPTANGRRKNKPGAFKKWQTIDPEKYDHIISNTEQRAKRDKGWLDGYNPMAATYLNQEQYGDSWEKKTFGSEDRPDVVDDPTIPSEGLLGCARFYNVCTHRDGDLMNAEQISKLVWAKKDRLRGVADEDNIHLTGGPGGRPQLPEDAYPLLDGPYACEY